MTSCHAAGERFLKIAKIQSFQGDLGLRNLKTQRWRR
jgi:hypothetical protein